MTIQKISYVVTSAPCAFTLYVVRLRCAFMWCIYFVHLLCVFTLKTFLVMCWHSALDAHAHDYDDFRGQLCGTPWLCQTKQLLSSDKAFLAVKVSVWCRTDTIFKKRYPLDLKTNSNFTRRKNILSDKITKKFRENKNNSHDYTSNRDFIRWNQRRKHISSDEITKEVLEKIKIIHMLTLVIEVL
jgi:hypothetical protein